MMKEKSLDFALNTSLEEDQRKDSFQIKSETTFDEIEREINETQKKNDVASMFLNLPFSIESYELITGALYKEGEPELKHQLITGDLNNVNDTELILKIIFGSKDKSKVIDINYFQKEVSKIKIPNPTIRFMSCFENKLYVQFETNNATTEIYNSIASNENLINILCEDENPSIVSMEDSVSATTEPYNILNFLDTNSADFNYDISLFKNSSDKKNEVNTQEEKEKIKGDISKNNSSYNKFDYPFMMNSNESQPNEKLQNLLKNPTQDFIPKKHYENLNKTNSSSNSTSNLSLNGNSSSNQQQSFQNPFINNLLKLQNNMPLVNQPILMPPPIIPPQILPINPLSKFNPLVPNPSLMMHLNPNPILLQASIVAQSAALNYLKSQNQLNLKQNIASNINSVKFQNADKTNQEGDSLNLEKSNSKLSQNKINSSNNEPVDSSENLCDKEPQSTINNINNINNNNTSETKTQQKSQPQNTINDLNNTTLLNGIQNLMPMMNLDLLSLANLTNTINNANKITMNNINNINNKQNINVNISSNTNTIQSQAQPSVQPQVNPQQQQAQTSSSSKLEDIIKNNKFKEYVPKSKQEKGIEFHTNSTRDYQFKYVSRYIVQIENEKNFPVTKMLIGNNGMLLRNIIIDNCIKFGDNTTKIRLRGRGSGYKEGPKNEESKDPMELCISSLNIVSFTKCTVAIETMLTNVYLKYYMYQCRALSDNPLNGGKVRYPVMMKKILKYQYTVNRFNTLAKEEKRRKIEEETKQSNQNNTNNNNNDNSDDIEQQKQIEIEA